MSTKLVALTFDEADHDLKAVENKLGVSTVGSNPERAVAVLKEIEQKAKDANARLEDAVVVYKAKDGAVSIKQTRDVTVGKGARSGAFWGLLAGVIFGGPLVGVLWGLGLGAIYGKAVDKGVDDKFIKNVGAALRPDSSAILLLIGEEDYDRAITYLKTFDTRIYEAELDQQVEAAMQKAVERKEIADAAEAEFVEN